MQLETGEAQPIAWQETVARRLVDAARGKKDAPKAKPSKAESLSPQAQAKTPAAFAFAKVEKNLASLGFFSPSAKGRAMERKTINFTKSVEEHRVEASVAIVPAADLGLPDAADQDKWIALQRIIADLRREKGRVENPVRFSSSEILRILGRAKNGSKYADIAQWLERMTLTGIVSKGVVYLAGKKVWASDTFHVFDRAVAVGRELPDGTVADQNCVWLSSYQLDNINANHLIPVDLETYRLLKNHIAKVLVPLLQVWLYASQNQGFFEKRYDELCQILHIRPYTSPSKIREKLAPSLDELTGHGYLAAWVIERLGQKRDRAYKVVFHHGEKFRRDLKLLRFRPGGKTDDPTLASPASKAKPEAAAPQDARLEELTKRGVLENAARQLLMALQPGQEVLDQLEWGDYLVHDGNSRIRNPAGFYIHLVRENCAVPETFETSRRRDAREAAAKAARGVALQEATERLAYETYCTEQITRHIEATYPGDEYRKLLETKKAALLHEKAIFRGWDGPALDRFVEVNLRAEIARHVSRMTFEEFRSRHPDVAAATG